MTLPRSARLAALAAAVAVAILVVIAWWWRDVPAFEGPHTFLELKGELEAVRVDPLERSAAEETYAVELRSSRGWTVHGHLRVPLAGAAGGRGHPGVIVLGGLGTGQKAAGLVRAREPYVVLGLDYPWAGSRRPGIGEIALSLPEIRHSVLRTPAALLLAADYLAGRPDTRGEDLALIGASFGVPFAAAAGALDDRFGTVLLIYGGADYRHVIAHNLERRYPWAPGFFADVGALLIQPVEPACYVPAIAPRRVVLVNGRRDERIPVESVHALFEAARDPKTLVWLDAPHISPRNDALLQTIADSAIHVLEALERGVRLPQVDASPAAPAPPAGAPARRRPEPRCPPELRAARPATILGADSAFTETFPEVQGTVRALPPPNGSSDLLGES